MNGRLGTAATQAVFGVAVHPVFEEIDVKGAQVDGAELVEGDENASELEGVVGGPAFGDDGMEFFHDPAID